MKRRLAIVQARMGSQRFPGKVLAELAGRPMLVRLLERLRRCKTLDGICVATTILPEDDAIESAALSKGALVHRGPVDDVLARYTQAAARFEATEVVRITADCPLVDPYVVDMVGEQLQNGKFSYSSNIYPGREFPRGLDVEAFDVATLSKMDKQAKTPAEREHVTAVIHANPGDYRHCKWNLAGHNGNSYLRWCVDFREDLYVVRQIYEVFRLGHLHVPYFELVGMVRRKPDLWQANRHLGVA